MIEPIKVHDMFLDCLYRQDELKEGKPIISPIEVEGIRGKFGLHPDRIKKYEAQIIDWLKELPNSFREEIGGGWSFLNGCMTHDEKDIWTGEQRIVDELFCLGIAIGKVAYCAPREMWSAMPGGVPYIKIIDIS